MPSLFSLCCAPYIPPGSQEHKCMQQLYSCGFAQLNFQVKLIIGEVEQVHPLWVSRMNRHTPENIENLSLYNETCLSTL